MKLRPRRKAPAPSASTAPARNIHRTKKPSPLSRLAGASPDMPLPPEKDGGVAPVSFSPSDAAADTGPTPPPSDRSNTVASSPQIDPKAMAKVRCRRRGLEGSDFGAVCDTNPSRRAGGHFVVGLWIASLTIFSRGFQLAVALRVRLALAMHKVATGVASKPFREIVGKDDREVWKADDGKTTRQDGRQESKVAMAQVDKSGNASSDGMGGGTWDRQQDWAAYERSKQW
ncbi:hypothetical protein HK101_003698 [Irineochytrium annulatum]|nr:hypothetical protein HK101_003698 [Irineochytrium annulatum]